jgi:hypothetical protein
MLLSSFPSTFARSVNSVKTFLEIHQTLAHIPFVICQTLKTYGNQKKNPDGVGNSHNCNLT